VFPLQLSRSQCAPCLPLIDVVRQGDYSHLSDGHKFVFVYHETGPEIIFVLDLVKEAAIATGAVAVAASQIIKLVNTICGIINKAADAKNKHEPSDRYYGAGAVSIEKRLSQGAKIVKQIKVTSVSMEDAVSRVQDLIN
jgi:hypothetical protein